MNLSLHPLPVWKERSFYAQLLLAASVLLNSAGIDLMAWLAASGFGATPDEVIDRGVSVWQALAPILFGLWAWNERRAPNYRLVIGGAQVIRGLLGVFALRLIVAMAFARGDPPFYRPRLLSRRAPPALGIHRGRAAGDQHPYLDIPDRGGLRCRAPDPGPDAADAEADPARLAGEYRRRAAARARIERSALSEDPARPAGCPLGMKGDPRCASISERPNAWPGSCWA